MSIYELLADVLVGIHLGYVSYVILGQLAIMIGWPLGWRWIRNPWFRITHLIMILIVAFEALISFECPLTTWERNLRIAANPAWQETDVSFIGSLLRRVMFFDSSWEPVLHTCYYVAAGVVLATVLLVPPRFRSSVADSSPPTDEVNASDPTAIQR